MGKATAQSVTPWRWRSVVVTKTRWSRQSRLKPGTCQYFFGSLAEWRDFVKGYFGAVH